MVQTRHNRPPSLYMRWTGGRRTSRQSRRPNFTANRHRTCWERAGEAAAGATVGNRKFRDFSAISGHFRPTHNSFPPFLDPLNSFPWSLFADSSPFESYNENKFGQWLDLFSGHHSDCWTKVMVLMSSWYLGLSIDMWFVNFGRRLISFPFLDCFG